MLDKHNILRLGLLMTIAFMPQWVQASKSTEVTSIGQAVIYGDDVANARDKAIQDAQRKAVEQSIGAMVSSETITENFQLISDKIISRSKGYIKTYQVLSESKQEGSIYQVKIKAQVSTGNLNKDLDGILALLNAKNMPRVLVMVAEQNVGQSNAEYWWGDKSFSTNLDAVENAIIDTWIPKGISFVDRQALQGKIKVGPALSNLAPSNDAIKEFANKTGAEVVVVGKAIATDAGTIMGTKMHSIRADMSVRALNLDNGQIMATATVSKVGNHINPVTGGTMALKKAGQAAADELLEKILKQWEKEVAGATTIKLVMKNIKRSRDIKKIKQFLGNQIRGVQKVRQRSYRNKVAQLEVEIKGSANDLADELEEKQFAHFSIEVDEITANTITVTVK